MVRRGLLMTLGPHGRECSRLLRKLDKDRTVPRSFSDPGTVELPLVEKPASSNN